MNKPGNESAPALLMFDGVCNMCGRLASLIMRWDKDRKFMFAPFQSAVAAKTFSDYGLDKEDVGSFILIKDNRARLKSDAVIGALEGLGGIFACLRVLRLVPAPIRDWAYDFVARNRYHLFGKSDRCMIPGPQFKDRFLGD